MSGDSKAQSQETIDSILGLKGQGKFKLGAQATSDTKAQIISLIEGILDNIENSVKQHTVPEGRHLVTRSYVLNTLEFERKRLKQLGGN
jgi:hypothetical protein